MTQTRTFSQAPAIGRKTGYRNLGKTMGRVFGYMLQSYKFSFILVVLCIIGSALATLQGTLFMQSLIDDYIVPLTQMEQPDFSPLAGALFKVGCIMPPASCAPTPTTGSWST